MIKLAVVTEQRAEQELKDAYLWYEGKAAGLGNRFLAEVEKALKKVQIQPEMFPKKKGNYRTIHLNVFPYLLIYEVLKKEEIILLLSVFHGKRNPKIKYGK